LPMSRDLNGGGHESCAPAAPSALCLIEGQVP
jgi:hypothetical protein